MTKVLQELLIAKAAIEIKMGDGGEVSFELGNHHRDISKAIKYKKGEEVENMPKEEAIGVICDLYGIPDAAIEKAMKDNVDFFHRHDFAPIPVLAAAGGGAAADIPQAILDESLAAFESIVDFNLAQALEASLYIKESAQGRAAGADNEQKIIEDSVALESAKAYKAEREEEVEFQLAIAASENQFSVDDANKAAHSSRYVSNLRAELASKTSWYDSIKHDLRMFSNLMRYNGEDGAAGAIAVWEESDMNIVKGKLANHMLGLTEDHTDAGMNLLAEINLVLFPE